MGTGRPLFTALLSITLALSEASAMPGRIALESRQGMEAFRMLANLYGRSSEGLRFQRLAKKVELQGKESTANSMLNSTSEALISASESLIFLFTVTGIELVHEELKNATFKKVQLTPKLIKELSHKAASDVLLSGTTWANIIGSVLAESLSRTPLKLVNALIEDTAVHPMAKSMVESGIFNIISYLGWDALDVFWQRARDEITDDKDYEKTERIGLLIWQAFSANASKTEAHEARRLLSLVGGHLYRFVLSDPVLRSSALYDVWRFRFVTGENAAFIAGWVGGEAIGTALCAGPCTFLGALAGGLLSTALPQETFDSISDLFGHARATADERRLDTIRMELKEIDRVVRGVSPTLISRANALKSSEERMAGLFARSQQLRQLHLTARFEILFRIFAQLKATQEARQTAMNEKDELAIRKSERHLEKLTLTFKRFLKETCGFYDRQIPLLKALDLDTSQPGIAAIVNQELQRLESMRAIMATMNSGILNGSEDDDLRLSNLILTKAKLLGFREDAFLSILP
jgi:hypothetical protein